MSLIFGKEVGWGCSSVGRVLDQHAAEVDSIPWCSKGFFSQSTFSADSITVSVHPLCATTCMKICSHDKDPVIHVRVQWIMEKQKHPACTIGWVAWLCHSWLSPGKATKIFLGEIPMGQYSCKKHTHTQKMHANLYLYMSALSTVRRKDRIWGKKYCLIIQKLQYAVSYKGCLISGWQLQNVWLVRITTTKTTGTSDPLLCMMRDIVARTMASAGTTAAKNKVQWSRDCGTPCCHGFSWDSLSFCRGKHSSWKSGCTTQHTLHTYQHDVLLVWFMIDFPPSVTKAS